MDENTFFDSVLPVISICIACLLTIIFIAMVVFIIVDGRKRNVSNLWVWVLLTFFTSIIGLVLYLLVGRKIPNEKPTVLPDKIDKKDAKDEKDENGEKKIADNAPKIDSSGPVKKGGWKNNKLIGVVIGLAIVGLGFGGLNLITKPLGLDLFGWLGGSSSCPLPASVVIKSCCQKGASANTSDMTYCYVNTGSTGTWDLNGTSMYDSGDSDGLTPNSCLVGRSYQIEDCP